MYLHIIDESGLKLLGHYHKHATSSSILINRKCMHMNIYYIYVHALFNKFIYIRYVAYVFTIHENNYILLELSYMISANILKLIKK